jgi:signal transduction histidine kinase/ligand-binding sensor domain-containing protein
MKEGLHFIPFLQVKCFLIILLLTLVAKNAHAQPYVKINSFSINEGLASNHIYDIIEDNKGFLWITTDNGVSRFDGKYFQNFSVKNGLPSNDVLQIVKEVDGTVWVNCYKQLPAYFDELNNQFIVYKNSKLLNEISGSLLLSITLPNGGVKLTAKKEQVFLSYFLHQKQSSNCIEFHLFKNEKRLDSLSFTIENGKGPITINDNKLYKITEGHHVYSLGNLTVNPVRFKVDSLSIPENIAGCKFSDHNVCIISTNNNVYIFDKINYALNYTIAIEEASNCAYVDKHKNLWIGTLDKGLICYANNGFKNVIIPVNLLSKNFLSIALNTSGEIFAGNYYGEALHFNGHNFNKYKVINQNTAWLRKIICINNKVVIVSDIGCSIGLNKFIQLTDKKNQQASLKTAIDLNDSIIIAGSIGGLISLNLNSLKSKQLNGGFDRTLSLAKINNDIIYYTGPQGLYKYSYKADSSLYIQLNINAKEAKLTLLVFAKDSTLWISTASGNILIIKNDHIIDTINNDAGLPENITCMLANKNKIWIGSKAGICIVEYLETNKKLQYKIWNVSKSDGLPSNTINDLAIYKDSIYVATENGIAIIPVNYQHPKYEIWPVLIDVQINQASVPIANSYTLQNNQNNIMLQFAGIDLSGHFKNIQYAIDNEKKFTDIIGNLLNIQLSSGKHTIFVKAIDVNKSGSSTLQIHFLIETLFYKTAWFWLLICTLLTALIFVFYNRQKLATQKITFQHQLDLEQQRNRITADLHDDIGASLSSLQLNSAIANKLMHKDVRQARLILDKIEIQSKNLADKIGDIIWSMKPGKDEFMTISSRIKNFVTDILSATNINYAVQVDKELDTVIKDIVTRKNIVFITKEALNNAVKYSQATHISIRIKLTANNIDLSIIDNGIGFTCDTRTGNGIANMQKRAQEISGIFKIISTPQAGSTITVLIPLIP